MQDFICVNSFKRSKRSVSEQKVIEVDNIKKCIRMQKDVLKGFLSLYTQNDLNLMRINEKKKNFFRLFNKKQTNQSFSFFAVFELNSYYQ